MISVDEMMVMNAKAKTMILFLLTKKVPFLRRLPPGFSSGSAPPSETAIP